jgi:hypothetical protein
MISLALQSLAERDREGCIFPCAIILSKLRGSRLANATVILIPLGRAGRGRKGKGSVVN